MILFPYARDIAFDDGELSFVIQFFDRNKTTDIEISIDLEDELASMIQDLMDQREEV